MTSSENRHTTKITFFKAKISSHKFETKSAQKIIIFLKKQKR